MNNPNSRAKITGPNNGMYKGDMWTDTQLKTLRRLCKDGYTVYQIADKIDGYSPRTVHNKIFELGILVRVGRHGNVWKVLTNVFGKAS